MCTTQWNRNPGPQNVSAGKKPKISYVPQLIRINIGHVTRIDVLHFESQIRKPTNVPFYISTLLQNETKTLCSSIHTTHIVFFLFTNHNSHSTPKATPYRFTYNTYIHIQFTIYSHNFYLLYMYIYIHNDDILEMIHLKTSQTFLHTQLVGVIRSSFLHPRKPQVNDNNRKSWTDCRVVRNEWNSLPNGTKSNQPSRCSFRFIFLLNYQSIDSISK